MPEGIAGFAGLHLLHCEGAQGVAFSSRWPLSGRTTRLVDGEFISGPLGAFVYSGGLDRHPLLRRDAEQGQMTSVSFGTYPSTQ